MRNGRLLRETYLRSSRSGRRITFARIDYFFLTHRIVLRNTLEIKTFTSTDFVCHFDRFRRYVDIVLPTESSLWVVWMYKIGRKFSRPYATARFDVAMIPLNTLFLFRSNPYMVRDKLPPKIEWSFEHRHGLYHHYTTSGNALVRLYRRTEGNDVSFVFRYFNYFFIRCAHWSDIFHDDKISILSMNMRRVLWDMFIPKTLYA